MPRVTILGSGNWACEGGRHQPAFLLQIADGNERHRYLIDCGDGTLHGLAVPGIPIESINAVVITHLHRDHIGGLPALLTARWQRVVNQQYPEKMRLSIYAPNGLDAMLRQSFSTPFPSSFLTEYGLSCYPTDGTGSISLGNALAAPYRVDHVQELDCFGWQFMANGKKIVFSGDMSNIQRSEASVLAAMQDADLLVIEAGAWSEECSAHLTAKQALAWAQLAGAKQVVLNHLDNRLAFLAAAAIRESDMNAWVARDRETYEV